MSSDHVSLDAITEALAGEGLHLGRFTGGAYRGELCCRPGGPGPSGPRRSLPPPLPADPDEVEIDEEAEQAAATLLESLLEPEQSATWRSTGLFWVDTPRGPVRLGRRYDLRHIAHDGRERSLCVVPDTFEYLPDGDEWATLLLWLRHDPDRFFDVALEAPRRNDPPAAIRPPSCTVGEIDPSGLARLIEVELERIEASILSGELPVPPLRTGHPGLDAQLGGLGPGAVALVVGRPGAGKTAFLIGLAARSAAELAARHDGDDPGRSHVVFCTPQADAETVLLQVLCHEGPLPRENVASLCMTDADWAAFAGAVGHVTTAPLVLHSGWDGIDPPWPLIAPDGRTLRLVVVDDTATLEAGIDESATRARELAHAHRCTVVLATTAHVPADVPGALADRVDVIVAVEDAHRRSGRPRRDDVMPKRLRVLKNRGGSCPTAAAVLVGPWGRLLAVDTSTGGC